MYTTAAVARGNFCRTRTQDTYAVAASSSAAAEKTAFLAVSMGVQGADSWPGGHQGLGVPLSGVRRRLCMARRHRGCPRGPGRARNWPGDLGGLPKETTTCQGNPAGSRPRSGMITCAPDLSSTLNSIRSTSQSAKPRDISTKISKSSTFFVSEMRESQGKRPS